MFFPKKEFVLMVAENIPAKIDSFYPLIQRKVFLFDKIFQDNFGKSSGYLFNMTSMGPYSEELQDDLDVLATIGLINGRKCENLTDLGASYLHGNRAEVRIRNAFNIDELKFIEALFCEYRQKTEENILKDAILAWEIEDPHKMDGMKNYFLPFPENGST